MSQDLSLFHIDQTLAQLLEYQAERLADTADPPDDEERAALESEIQKYMEALPAKVDGVAAYLLMLKSKRAAVRAEIDRLKALEAAAAARIERINRYVADILDRQPMPKKGPRKLAGATSELRLVGNGGLQPLVITDEDAIPMDCKKATVVMPADEWASFKEHMMDIGMTLISDRVDVDNQAVREAIIDTGGVPGAHLNPRGAHVEVK